MKKWLKRFRTRRFEREHGITTKRLMTTRTVDMAWRTRSLRVLPMLLLPALSFGSVCIMGF
ncbi:hypothetical protein HanRHA438_Chr03g0141911 [Helianthus annuus]|uniref:Uncharacterized protein n=1 Tax=Helianthus annuus TaxID=4232 RepID=A0A9K3JJB0_HELAN|nr:hypothetical protein HanXRQr2_Chr03g0130511 [Helianthus annuus]KAJ0594447.1 hypothetical protein HanHA300_Chr03g0108661 [Helianthus annuus]KAJ0602630.1 hypothetical protein HanIR_Chr03g0141891 [Helianthus annuus]KAJ0609483.1 hypothetical protein HanHA89_Chr03g0120501 [Helianthus annuus]KAJ0769541.1 hypothetical protein HanLR1_Chr03g0113921 [Helianthus annuus]